MVPSGEPSLSRFLILYSFRFVFCYKILVDAFMNYMTCVLILYINNNISMHCFLLHMQLPHIWHMFFLSVKLFFCMLHT